MAGTDLGPWQGDDLRATAASYNGDGADDDMPDFQRFARSVGRLILKRQRLAGAAMRRDAISVFLLRPEVPSGVSKREPTLGDGDVDVAGRIWFVPANAQSGRYIVPSSPEPGDIFDQVEAMGCGASAAVVYNPRAQPPCLRYYRKGIERDDDVQVIELHQQPLTVGRVEAILHRMWEHCFITPDAQIAAGSDVWENSVKFYAKTNAEALMQAHMKTALAVALLDCVIRHEQPMSCGRVDLEIEQETAHGLTRPLEIEVKVLRERGATGRPKSDVFNDRWVRRGIRQAAAYRKERKAQHGMLCCFDMRAADRGDPGYCSSVALAYAAKHSVPIFRRFLYHDAEALRVAELEP